MVASEPNEDVPASVRTLLLERVQGFEHLEALVWFCGEQGRSSTVAEVAARLGMDAAVVAQVLDDLRKHALLVATDPSQAAYRFQPESAALRETCRELCAIYAADRFRIVNLMSRIAFDRIHSSVTAAFASAFRLRKSDGGDPDA